MALSAKARLTIPFHDIDVMNIAWHGHYLKYFEIGRTALMQSLQLDWPDLKKEGIVMPVVEAHANYRRAIAYGQELWVEATIEEYEYPELKVNYRLLSSDAAQVFATGWTRQIYRKIAEESSCFEVPEFIRQRFQKNRGVSP